MNKFNIKKFLIENKLTKASKLSESRDDLYTTIYNWYVSTNLEVDEMDEEDVVEAVRAHVDEFEAVKDRYKNLKHYLESIEEAGDWY